MRTKAAWTALAALIAPGVATWPATRAERPAQEEAQGEARLDLGAGAPSAAEAAEPARARAALEKGLAWLSSQQALQPDGSFPSGGAQHYVPVPLAALGALAYLAGGSTLERGPHGAALSRAVDYLLERTDLDPSSSTLGFIGTSAEQPSKMHGHGFAALALSQAWAVSPRTSRGQRMERALEAAVRLIERTQGVEGGWFYQPARVADHENSVTVCLVQALRAAQGVGIQVDLSVVERARDYVRRCQAQDGSFQYGLFDTKTSVALTAAGIATLNMLGQYEGPELERAMESLWQRLGYRALRDGGPPTSFPHYERLYLAQALWQHRDPRLFERWYADERARVLATQSTDGSWSDPAFGPCFATAMNCLFLAIPGGVLPIFQR